MAKIIVGMSGGVDSSVSAALLARAGHDVVGAFIKVWQPDWLECEWREERLDAMRAAARIGIPFETVDLEDEYKRGVVDYMIAEYAAGRTPNPDVMCNREVKFGAFWRWAKEHGADFIATGHYARNEDGPNGPELHISKDLNKDQTYFLWTLAQDDLSHVMFPVGDLTKPEVRAMAKKFKLPNADKKDSQGLCFMGKVDIKEFLAHYIEPNPGAVLNEKGEAIGTHTGAELLTIGERHGFTVTKKTPNDAPLFIIAKDVRANTVTVSERKSDSSLPGARIRAKIERVNWIGRTPERGANVQARARYREALREAVILDAKDGAATIEFATRESALAPGQSLVMYDGDRCLGGGIIA